MGLGFLKLSEKKDEDTVKKERDLRWETWAIASQPGTTSPIGERPVRQPFQRPVLRYRVAAAASSMVDGYDNVPARVRYMVTLLTFPSPLVLAGPCVRENGAG